MLTNPDQTALINMSFIVSVGKVDHIFVNPRGMAHTLCQYDFTKSVNAIFQRKCLKCPIKAWERLSVALKYTSIFILIFTGAIRIFKYEKEWYKSFDFFLELIRL